jgi:hypothetical protein
VTRRLTKISNRKETHMKTICAAVVLGLLALAPAYAGSSVPKEAVGKWCAAPNEDASDDGKTWKGYYVPWNSSCESDSAVYVDHKGFTGFESGCNFKTVRTAFDRGIASTSKTMGVNVAHISADCAAEACEYRSTLVLYVSKGVLTIRGRNGKDTCD